MFICMNSNKNASAFWVWINMKSTQNAWVHKLVSPSQSAVAAPEHVNHRPTRLDFVLIVMSAPFSLENASLADSDSGSDHTLSATEVRGCV
jgi:hypothetical protein